MFTVNPVFNLKDETMGPPPLLSVSHFSCHRWRLFCLMIFFSSFCSPRMLLRWLYSYFLSSLSTSMGIRPAMIHTASSDTVRKALGTLSALNRLTAAIFHWYFSILRALPQMAIPYLSIEVTTEAKSFLREWRGPPMSSISTKRCPVAASIRLKMKCSSVFLDESSMINGRWDDGSSGGLLLLGKRTSLWRFHRSGFLCEACIVHI